jgi:hypothetical protein
MTLDGDPAGIELSEDSELSDADIYPNRLVVYEQGNVDLSEILTLRNAINTGFNIAMYFNASGDIYTLSITDQDIKDELGNTLQASTLVVGDTLAFHLEGDQLSYLLNGNPLAEKSINRGADLFELSVEVNAANGEAVYFEVNKSLRSVEEYPIQQLSADDIIFIGFDNYVNGEQDRIIISNMVDLNPGVSFMLSNAVYCNSGDSWYPDLNKDSVVASQLITYLGDTPLPIGSIICFDLPGAPVDTSTQLLANNFSIDGLPTDDFRVRNNGLAEHPDINLSTTGLSGLFLLQGNWTFLHDRAKLAGSVLSSIQLGDADGWDQNLCGADSDLHPDLACTSGPNFSESGSLYAFFDCSQGGTTYSRMEMLEAAIDLSNWNIQAGTNPLDLPTSACDLNCLITQDSLYWMIPPDTLIVDCVNDPNVAQSIQSWLDTYGSGVVNSSCNPDTVTIINDYNVDDLNYGCSASGLSVNFTAIDSCENRASAVGIIQVAAIAAPVFTTLPSDSIVNCGPISTISKALDGWLASHGGANVSVGCGSVEWGVMTETTPSDCSVFDQVEAQFFAIGSCGDTLMADPVIFQVIDNTAPVINSVSDLNLNCDAADLEAQIASWLNSGGNADAADDCSLYINWTNDYAGYQGGCESVTVTFTADDGCGNTSGTSATLNIIDTTAPEISKPGSNLIVYLTSPYTYYEAQIQNWLARHGDALAIDCGEVTWSDDFNEDISMLVCGSIPVEFTASDDCGNSATTNLSIDVIDHSRPVITSAPADLIVDCSDGDIATQVNNWLAVQGNAVASDSIQNGSLSWTYAIIDTVGSECGRYENLFIVSDGCGNSTEVSGYVEVNDDGLSFGDLASDKTVDCNLSVSAQQDSLNVWLADHGGASVIEGCGTVSWAYDTTQVAGGCGGVMSTEAIFYAISSCGDTLTSETVYFSGEDMEAPVVSGGSSILLNCIDPLLHQRLNDWLSTAGGANIVDNCATEFSITNNFPTYTSGCWTGLVTFDIDDGCGNIVTSQLPLSIADGINPNFTNYGYDLTVNIDDPDFVLDITTWRDNHGWAVAVDCNEMSWTNDLPADFSSLGCGTHPVTFTVTDACNRSNTTQLDLIINDTTSIVITQAPQDLVLDCDAVDFESQVSSWLANNGNAIASGGNISWDNEIPVGYAAVCGSYEVIFTASNDCNQSNQASAYIQVQDNTLPTIVNAAVDTCWAANDPLLESKIDAWLAANGLASASDNCQGNLEWTHSLSQIPTGGCFNESITFYVSDGCNVDSSSATLQIYDPGLDFIVAGADLDLTCCSVDTNEVNNWLNSQAGAVVLTICGQNLNWSYSGYDANLLDSCELQTITFQATGECGALYEFSQDIRFTADECCGNVSLTLEMTEGLNGELYVAVNSSNCVNPVYSWEKNGQALPAYDGMSQVPYDIEGPGAYTVTVDCDGEACSGTATLELCEAFTPILICEGDSIHLDMDSLYLCNNNLNINWYKNGSIYATNVTSIGIDAIGFYEVEMDCAGYCNSEALLAVGGCQDVNVTAVNAGDSIFVDVQGCHPPINNIYWTINGDDMGHIYDGMSIIPNTISGSYEVEVSFVTMPCTITDDIDICNDEFVASIDTLNNQLIASSTGCQGEVTYNWFAGDPLIYIGSGDTLSPGAAGEYILEAECFPGCVTTTTYNWTLPCSVVEIEIDYYQNNNSIQAQISGASCEDIDPVIDWYLDGNWVTGGANNFILSYTHLDNFSGDVHAEVSCGSCMAISNPIAYQDYDCNGQDTALITQDGQLLTATVNGLNDCVGELYYEWTYGTSATPFSAGYGHSTTGYDASYYGIINLKVSCDMQPDGCAVYDNIEVAPCFADPGTLQIDVNDPTQLIVTGASIDNCNGELRYAWSYNNITFLDTTLNTYTPLQTGNYQVRVYCSSFGTCQAETNYQFFEYTPSCEITINIQETNGELFAVVGGADCDETTQSFEWFRNGQSMGEYTSSIIPTQNGLYSVQVNCGSGACVWQSTGYYFVFDSPCMPLPSITMSCVNNGKGIRATVNGVCPDGIFKWYHESDMVNPVYISNATDDPEISTYFPGPVGNYIVELSNCENCDTTIRDSLDYGIGNNMGVTIQYNSSQNRLEANLSNGCPAPSYSWSFEGSGIGTDSPHLTPSNVGIYSVNVTCPTECTTGSPTYNYYWCDGCEVSLVDTWEGNESRADKASDWRDSTNEWVKLYPNPTRDEVFIDVQLAAAQAVHLNIYDASGRQIVGQNLDLDKGQHQLRYATSTWPSGVYLVSIQSAAALYYDKLMVIRK